MTGKLLIEIPERSLVLLVGAAGAGKSTFAQRHFPGEAIISSDSLREAIAGDAADQTRNRAVFGAVHRELERRLAAGRLAVVDATNVTAAARREVRERARRTGTRVIAIVLAPPAVTVNARNAARPGRHVPDDVVARHLAAIDRLLDRGTLDAEGYSRVIVLRDPAAIAALEVRVIPTVLVGREAETAPAT